MNESLLAKFRRGAACVVVTALLGALAFGRATAVKDDELAGERLTRVLLSSESAATLDTTARMMIKLGPDAIEPLVRALVNDGRACNAAQRAAALSVLRERAAETERCVVLLAQRGLPPRGTMLALDLIAEVATERGLSSLIKVAASAATVCDEEQDPESNVASTLRRAAARLLVSRADTARQFTAVLHDCPQEFVAPMLQALADTPTSDALLILADLLRERAWDRLFLLDEISRAARTLKPPFDDHVCSTVRSELEGSNDALVREAAACAGWLEDERSVPALIEHLDDSNAGVRGNVLWALRHITGRKFDSDPTVWRRWCDAQNEWWSSQAPRVFANLGCNDATKRASAINEVLRHDFPRHELARQLAQTLSPTDMLVFRLGCSALAALRSNAAEPALRVWLTDRDPEVNQLARSTLDRIGSGAPRVEPSNSSGPGVGTASGRGLPRVAPLR